MGKINKKERQSEMFSLVEQWHNSKETKKSFSTKHNINIYTFDYWVQKYLLSNNKSDFIELKPTSSIPSKANIQTVKFSFSGDVEAEVPVEFALDFMQQLVRR